MAQPGSIGSQMPASEDTQLRKFADLERSVRELGPSIAASFQTTVNSLNETIATQAVQITDLAATNAELATQTAYQAGLVTLSAEGGLYIVNPVPADSTYRYVDTEVSITLAVPTGRVLVTVGCSEALVNPGNDTTVAKVTFNVTREGESGTWWANGIRSARVRSESGTRIGASVNKTLALDCGVGTRTFTLAYGSWSNSAVSAADIHVDSPSITVQVVPA